MVSRRRFLQSASSTLLAVPLVAQAQQPGRMHRLGYLSSATPPDPSDARAGAILLPKSLNELGYLEGRNLVIERRFAEGKLDRLPALAGELVAARVDVIVAVASTALRAAKDATQTIPIVMGFGPPDPVSFGFVKSLASPGGNITGVTYWAQRGYEAKRLELLKETVPQAARVTYLVWPGQDSQALIVEAQSAAPALGIKLAVVAVPGGDYDAAFAAMRNGRTDAALVQGNPVFNRDRMRLIALAAQHRVPMMYEWRHHVEDGGLIAYGGDIVELHRRVASYVDRIFKGAKPSELPVEQPTRFELVINLKTAKTLGLTIPPSLLVRADHVIE
jgi:putative ABC transport system substrate-binding protein